MRSRFPSDCGRRIGWLQRDSRFDHHAPAPLDWPFCCIYNIGSRTQSFTEPRMTAQSDESIVDRIASGCIASRVRILNRAISAIYDDALRPSGLKVSQMNILVVTA